MAATLGMPLDSEQISVAPKPPSSKEASGPAAPTTNGVHSSPLRPLKCVPPSSTQNGATPTTATPKRTNPFARSTSDACASFKRTSLLPPTAQSPMRSPHPQLGAVASPHTPAAKRGWRLLWRGGLEVGPDGWRLDGITFLARITPGTASPFPSAGVASAAVFAAANNSPNLPSDADLSLSLESLRGRKFLQVRGLTLVEDEEIDHGDSVQVSITSPLLAAYVENLFSRAPLVGGRTVSGLVVGLGDEGVDATAIILYGQRDGNSLRLCVGRRRVAPAPAEKKIRPGEPLPRAPRYFPANPPKKPPPPFPNRRSMSRATSVSSAYAAPQQSAPPSLSPISSTMPLPNGLNGRSPGRRGEKRPRRAEEDDRRRRKAGRIVPEPGASSATEDVGGRASVAPGQPQPLSQRATDNKAMIRKRAMQAMESRGCSRSHAEFKELFGMVTRGAYFALRSEINGKLDKYRVSGIVHQHLDMYLSPVSDSEDERRLRPEPTLVDIKSEPE